MKKINVFLVLILTSFCFYGQTLEKHKNVVAGLNNYMEFIHQTTHCEFIFIYDFKNFNADILQQIKYPNREIIFNRENVIDNDYYFDVVPKDIYNICLTSQFGITKTEKDSLDVHIKKMMISIQKMQDLNDSMSLYCSEKKYLTDLKMQNAFVYLENAQKEFSNYLFEWKFLVENINKTFAKYRYTNMNDPFLRTAVHLDTLFNVVYELAENIRNNDTNLVRRTYNKLNEQIVKLDGKQDFYLDGAERYGSSHGKDPYNRFEMIMGDAKAELSHTEYFLKKSTYPLYEENKYGKDFVYYNFKIVNKFNRHGLGMAYEYNHMADNSENLMLKKAQLPHTFKVLYPPTETPPPPAKDTVVIIENLTLQNAPPDNLIFLLDVSGSMNTKEKLPVLKEAIKFLILLMRDFDYVTIITYSGKSEILLQPTSAKNTDSILLIIDKMYSSGTTNVYSGLQTAYKSAKRSFIPNGTNRIILATDGNFEITEDISKIVSKNASKISLSILYFEKIDAYFENLSKLSDIGKGNCTKVTHDNIKEVLVKEARGE